MSCNGRSAQMTGESQEAGDDDAVLFECFICAHEFSAEAVSSFEDGAPVDRRPVTLPCCGNTVCLNCVTLDRAAKVAELGGNRKRIPCIHCGEPYHSEKAKFVTSKRLIDIIARRRKLRMRDGDGGAPEGGGENESSGKRRRRGNGRTGDVKSVRSEVSGEIVDDEPEGEEEPGQKPPVQRDQRRQHRGTSKTGDDNSVRAEVSGETATFAPVAHNAAQGAPNDGSSAESDSSTGVDSSRAAGAREDQAPDAVADSEHSEFLDVAGDEIPVGLLEKLERLHPPFIDRSRTDIVGMINTACKDGIRKGKGRSRSRALDRLLVIQTPSWMEDDLANAIDMVNLDFWLHDKPMYGEHSYHLFREASPQMKWRGIEISMMLHKCNATGTTYVHKGPGANGGWKFSRLATDVKAVAGLVESDWFEIMEGGTGQGKSR